MQASLIADKPEQLGDVFYGGHYFPLMSKQQLEKKLGADFSKQAFDLVAHQWSDPIRSSYGYHLVWIHKRLENEYIPFAEVVALIRQRMLQEKREIAVTLYIKKILTKYPLAIDSTN